MRYIQFGIALSISIMISLLEIINRYKRTKREAIINFWAIFYFIANGIMAMVVFWCIDQFEWKIRGLSDEIFNGWLPAIVAGTSWKILVKMKFAESEIKIPIIAKVFDEFFEDEIKQLHFVKLFNLKRKLNEKYRNGIDELSRIIEQLMFEQFNRDKDKEYIDELVSNEDIHQITDFIIRNLVSSWVRKNLLKNG